MTCLLQSLMRWVVCCPDSLSTTSRHNWDCFFLSASKQHFAFGGVGKWLCSQPGVNPTQHRSLEKPILCRLHDQLFWEHWIYIKGLVALRCIHLGSLLPFSYPRQLARFLRALSEPFIKKMKQVRPWLALLRNLFECLASLLPFVTRAVVVVSAVTSIH